MAFKSWLGLMYVFSPDELDIILNRINLEICEHSSFLRNCVLKQKYGVLTNSTKLSLLIKPIEQLGF